MCLWVDASSWHSTVFLWSRNYSSLFKRYVRSFNTVFCECPESTKFQYLFLMIKIFYSTLHPDTSQRAPQVEAQICIPTGISYSHLPTCRWNRNCILLLCNSRKLHRRGRGKSLFKLCACLKVCWSIPLYFNF